MCEQALVIVGLKNVTCFAQMTYRCKENTCKVKIFCTLPSNQLIKPFLCSRTKAEIDEFASVSLKDISIVKTLGVGGFGRVELVSFKLN